MSKRLMAILVGIVLLLSLSGCEDGYDKFVRHCHEKGGVVVRTGTLSADKCYSPDGKFIPIERTNDAL